jgi:hypothetical protein
MTIVRHTLMSTDIIHFESKNTTESGKSFQLGALQLYFEISVTLMVLT